MEEDGGGTPPCFAHELVGGQPVDAETARDVARFREAERARLVAARRNVPAPDRATMTEALAGALDRLVAPEAGLRLAVYWPIRGEPDLRGWMARAHAAGATVLLPVVVRKAAPLVFRTWSPGCAMERGAWNIPVPSDGAETHPDVVVAPLVGVDRECFRLGNGGGYYDRTLAALDPRPRAIGVGFPDCRIPTIYPMPWDVPMQSVILADGSVQHRA
jgi:5-formyltetrahydrofolate cyclo-ligase